MIKLQLEALAAAVSGVLHNTNEREITPRGVSIDSRDDLTGQIFIPLKGTRDGHDFLEMAFEKGAILAISEKPVAQLPYIQVESTHQAIKDFAKFYKSLFEVLTVAITGSVGKTTTKDLTASVLAQKFNVVKTQGNFNNEIGLPLTVFHLEKETEQIILEMGMNHFGEIHNLAEIAKPDVAIITNIGEAHIENLGSREGILKAKSEIFDFAPKEIILNGDDALLLGLKEKYPNARLYYLNKPEEKYTAYNITHNALKGTKATLKIEEHLFEVDIPITGEYMVRNALVGAIVGFINGVSVEAIKKGIETFKPSKNRMDVTEIGNLTIINDVYNASPQSIKTMLDVLEAQKGRKVAILGDMFELGDHAVEMHKEIGRYVREKKIDELITIGALSHHTYMEALTYEKGNRIVTNEYVPTKSDFLEEIEDRIKALSEQKTTVLIKASRGMGFEDIVDALIQKNKS